MIQANELRIGNWLFFFNRLEPGRYIQVTGRMLAHAQDFGDGGFGPYYDGIPLTPEILEKAGFKKHYFFNEWDFPTYLKWDIRPHANDEYKIYYDGELLEDAAPLKYVHQLQNFYFALTGEELIIEL